MNVHDTVDDWCHEIADEKGSQMIDNFVAQNTTIKKCEIDPYDVIKNETNDYAGLEFEECMDSVNKSFKFNKSIFVKKEFVLFVKMNGK